MKIATIEDIAKHLHAKDDTAASIARRVYKSTACGCPAGVEDGKVGEHLATYVVTARLSIRGWMILHWRPAHGKRRRVPRSACEVGKIDEFGFEIAKIPPELQRFLLVDKPYYTPDLEEQWRQKYEWGPVIGCSESTEPHKEFGRQFMEDLAVDDVSVVPTGLLRKTRSMRGMLVHLTVRVKEPVLGTYFWVAGYCEGSDWEHPVHQVPLPCTGEDINKAIDLADEEGKETWDQTHGCEKCFPEGAVDEYGNEFAPEEAGGPINSDCETCGGNGVVL
jgi:hypothetical protein